MRKLFQSTIIFGLFISYSCDKKNDEIVPLAPSNLSAEGKSTTQIDLVWTDNSTNEDGFKIERKTGSDNYTIVTTLSSDITAFSDIGLIPNTSYSYRVYSYNSAGQSITYSNEAIASTLLNIEQGEGVMDQESNFYPTVIIGDQEWLAANLRATKLNDGTNIVKESNLATFVSLTIPAYTWYNNDVANKGSYGALYNWSTVSTGKCCPIGWRVPSDADWTKLTDALGGEIIAGGKLKEQGTTHWDSPNIGATNITGFTALPGGYIFTGGAFSNIKTNGFWWTSTEFGTDRAYSRILYFNDEKIVRHSDYFKNLGLSIRCIKN